MCQRRSQRWLALLRIMSALAERLQIRRSRGPARTKAFPRQRRCAHIFEARYLQVVWPRSPQTGPRTLGKRKHLLDLKRQTPSLNTRNVRSRGCRGKHSKKLTPRVRPFETIAARIHLPTQEAQKLIPQTWHLTTTSPQCVDSHPLERRWRREPNR